MNRMILMLVAIVVLAGCVKNDCDSSPYALINAADLAIRSSEDSPSIRWLWCEGPLPVGTKIPEGRLGPLTNIWNGASYGYGAWIRVLADDATVMLDVANSSDLFPAGTRMEASDPQYWRWAAALQFIYPRAVYAEHFYIDLMKRDRLAPGQVECFFVQEMKQKLDEYIECRTQARNSPISDSARGVAGSSTGTGTSGDWGPN